MVVEYPLFYAVKRKKYTSGRLDNVLHIGYYVRSGFSDVRSISEDHRFRQMNRILNFEVKRK